MGIRARMILLISAVVTLSAVLPAAVSLLRVRGILRSKTVEICLNLGNYVSNLSREELLVDETYNATHDAMRRLEKGQQGSERVEGLVNSYVVNFDGVVVAALDQEQLGQRLGADRLLYFRSLSRLDLADAVQQRTGRELLRFSYPIFIHSFQGENLRVGTTVFEFDRQQIYQPVADLTRFIVYVTLGLLALGLLVALATGLYFAGPIRVLTDGARQLGAGQLGHRIQLNRSDELGVLAKNFNRMAAEIQDFTGNLEDKVRERTHQLKLSLEEVQSLKTQQDGDYFLTSLLLEPFRRNENANRDRLTEFVIDQKKKFEFKDWKAEIGGDYCLTDSVRIGSREYTVFLNADAMGKSIQGAGGALVLATVFQAFLALSQDGRFESQRPELWLRECYLGLQKIFVTFRGAMFVTMVLGLADETGCIYFVNAEHPPCVLYRSGRASYVDEVMWLRKLGTPNEERNLRVRLLSLEPGDVFYAGSDGKDDIAPNESGRRLAKAGDWFLMHVEAAKGKLAALLQSLKAAGEVKDDISILRLEYRPTEDEDRTPNTRGFRVRAARVQELLQLAKQKGSGRFANEVLKLALEPPWPPGMVELVGQTVDYHRSKNQLARAFALLEAHLFVAPNDGELLLALADVAMQLKDYSRASDFSECVRLRDPQNETALHFLAEIHLKTGDLRRAQNVIEQAIGLDADNALVQRLHADWRKKKGPALLSDDEKIPEAELNRLLGNLERQMRGGFLKPALALCRQVLALDSENAVALERMGDCHLMLKNYPRAAIDYNKLLFVSPSRARARNNLAVAYAAQGKYELAAKQLERALSYESGLQVARRNTERLSQAQQAELEGIELEPALESEPVA